MCILGLVQVDQIRKDNEERHRLAQERQYLWSKMAQMRLSPELASLGDRVKIITRQLNGHAYDIGADGKPRTTAAGGSYEQKRWDRNELERYLQIHESQRTGLTKEGGDGPKSKATTLRRVTPQLRRILVLHRNENRKRNR
jgi:hypothetical protein